MFSGTVDRVSHEGGLLVSYTGACPALGSVMVDSNHEYIGKVDGVIGNTESSLVHIAHLDRKSRAEKLVGITVQIRTKKPNQNRTFDRRNDRRNDRRQSNQISNSRDWECKSCGNSNFSFIASRILSARLSRPSLPSISSTENSLTTPSISERSAN